MYYTKLDPHGVETYLRIANGTISCFIADPANTDYQQYLAWVAAGNTPEPWEG